MGYTIGMARKRIYAVHYGLVIPNATVADYTRDYYIDRGKARRVMRWLFYRQDAAGRVEVREYHTQRDPMAIFDALTAAGTSIEFGKGGAWKFEPCRPGFQRWHLGINPHTGRKEN